MKYSSLISIAFLQILTVANSFSQSVKKWVPAATQNNNDPAFLFKHPPESAKPGVLWMWMGSNISKEGITKDLEALKKQGFNKTTMYSLADITTPWNREIFKSPNPDIIAWTAPWWKLVRHAAIESKRLGMDFGMHNCPGYESSDGVWITPELSMQELCWSASKIISEGDNNVYAERPIVDPTAKLLWPVFNPETGLVENPITEVFSVRELYPGDNYHLALAYFLSGMGDDGWDIMKGTFYESAFNGNVPGDLGAKKGGTDFNDCSSMFTRALIEGLFGYRPDYPNKKVTIAPQFPKEWNNASISTPDFSFEFSNKQNTINALVSLSKPAAIHFYFPVKVTAVKKVLVNGKPVQWKLLPGYGQSLLYLQLNEQRNTIIIEVTGMCQLNEPIKIEKNIGDIIQLKLADRKIVNISDLQKVFKKVKILNGVLNGTLSNNIGHHTLISEVITGKAPQKQIIYFNITDKASAEKEKLRYVSKIPANAEWNCVDMNGTFNGDIRTIYQQKYLSPRPNTVSARIGTDGYSAWTFIFWKQVPPIIKLDSVKYLKNDSNRILTKQQIPFQWNGVEKNIAFTSLWDNWPKNITVPVQQKGQAIWLMVAGSTNQMQCDIANAMLIFNYADKSRDSLSLVPPYNYWNLSPINIKAGAAGQESRGDYTNVTDEFAVPKPWPQTVQLGENCRAMLLNKKLKPGVVLNSVTLQTLSQEVVVGLMGVTIMK